LAQIAFKSRARGVVVKDMKRRVVNFVSSVASLILQAHYSENPPDLGLVVVLRLEPDSIAEHQRILINSFTGECPELDGILLAGV
jgi:hypothetical protein